MPVCYIFIYNFSLGVVLFLLSTPLYLFYKDSQIIGFNPKAFLLQHRDSSHNNSKMKWEFNPENLKVIIALYIKSVWIEHA